jgi:DNA-binding transcriptional MerR regulator
MLIGEIVKETGVTRDAIRHYEAKGLIPEPNRRENNYKDYAPDTIRRIRFIQTMQHAGFTLRQTRSFVELQEQGAATCANTGVHIQEHLAQLDAKIAELSAMRSELKTLFQICADNAQDDLCTPIAEALSSG